MPKQTLFYTYIYDTLGNELPTQYNTNVYVNYALSGGGTTVDLSPGKQDIIISFTPILNNTENYEIDEILFHSGEGNGSTNAPNRYNMSNGSFYNNSPIEMNIKDVKNGVRRHIRMSDLYDATNFSFGNRRVLTPILRNKTTGVDHPAWVIDGEKQYPQTQDDFNNFTFYLKDVEVRVINQIDDVEEEVEEEVEVVEE